MTTKQYNTNYTKEHKIKKYITIIFIFFFLSSIILFTSNLTYSYNIYSRNLEYYVSSILIINSNNKIKYSGIIIEKVYINYPFLLKIKIIDKNKIKIIIKNMSITEFKEYFDTPYFRNAHTSIMPPKWYRYKYNDIDLYNLTKMYTNYFYYNIENNWSFVKYLYSLYLNNLSISSPIIEFEISLDTRFNYVAERASRVMGFFPLYSSARITRDFLEDVKPAYFTSPLAWRGPMSYSGSDTCNMIIDLIEIFTTRNVTVGGESLRSVFRFSHNYLVNGNNIILKDNDKYIVLGGVVPTCETARFLAGLPGYFGGGDWMAYVAVVGIVGVAIVAVYVWRR